MEVMRKTLNKALQCVYLYSFLQFLRACVRAFVRACVRACVCGCNEMRHIMFVWMLE